MSPMLQVLHDADGRVSHDLDSSLFRATLVYEHDHSPVPSGDAASPSSLGGATEAFPKAGVVSFVLEVLNLGRRVKKAGRRNQLFQISVQQSLPDIRFRPLVAYSLPFSTHSRVLNLVHQSQRGKSSG